MSWRTEWKAISDRIEGTLKAGSFYIQCVSINASDPGAVADRVLIPSAREIRESIIDFHKDYHSQLPTSAASCLDRFLRDAPKFFEEQVLKDRFGVQVTLTALMSFCAEFTYKITDASTLARRLSERALSHLQRSIVADATTKASWIEAFNHHETSCEKLGAVHLLQHGIWAFKVDGAGERTDLVFGEPLTDLSEVERTAEALVLTEWKRVQEPSKLREKIDEARGQASRYSVGVLGGLELVGYRYLVLVSENFLRMPPDEKEREATYRHINIAVAPKPPSRR